MRGSFKNEEEKQRRVQSNDPSQNQQEPSYRLNSAKGDPNNASKKPKHQQHPLHGVPKDHAALLHGFNPITAAGGPPINQAGLGIFKMPQGKNQIGAQFNEISAGIRMIG